ncbi:MAG TPA: amino acid-binding protein [Frankiaceae bacterium]|nr:amino acid-binding protein [Frankiaceae bacterium]
MSTSTYLLRLVLPDRPGSLGAVATALGAEGVDIETLDVVERGPFGSAVDDLVVSLPSDRMAETLITACQSVPDVRVESLRPHSRAAETVRDLGIVDAIAADPARAVERLAELAPEAFRCSWAVVFDARTPGTECVGEVPDVRRISASSAAPPIGTCPVPDLPMTGARRVSPEEAWVPADWRDRDNDLAVAACGSPYRVLLVARPGGPLFRASEVMRLAHLANLAGISAAMATVQPTTRSVVAVSGAFG